MLQLQVTPAGYGGLVAVWTCHWRFAISIVAILTESAALTLRQQGLGEFDHSKNLKESWRCGVQHLETYGIIVAAWMLKLALTYRVLLRYILSSVRTGVMLSPVRVQNKSLSSQVCNHVHDYWVWRCQTIDRCCLRLCSP